MKARLFAALALAAGMLAAPQAANATNYGHGATGYVTNDLNLRACASTRCHQVAVMPRGSTVWLGARQGSWYQVNWNGYTGWASANYISTQYVAAPPPVVHPPVVYRPRVPHRPPVVVYQPPAPQWGHDWRDGPRKKRGRHNRGYGNQPSGIYFNFSYGR